MGRRGQWAAAEPGCPAVGECRHRDDVGWCRWSHEGRGLCGPCLALSRPHGKSQEVLQAVAGEEPPQGPRSHLSSGCKRRGQISCVCSQSVVCLKTLQIVLMPSIHRTLHLDTETLLPFDGTPSSPFSPTLSLQIGGTTGHWPSRDAGEL